MGLKDLQSIYDLVPGNNKPVGKMDEQQGDLHKDYFTTERYEVITKETK